MGIARPGVCFNSIVVRLKARIADMRHRFGLGFNSIVVRLKDAGRGWHGWHAGQFQFHSGSIKSRQRERKTSINVDVSIP